MFYLWTIILICLYFIQYEVNGVEYNIALNQNVTTSNVVANHPVSLATDLKLSTYVQVDYVFGVPAWIVFDLRLYTWNITKIIIWPTNDNDYSLAKVGVYQTYTSSIEYPVNDKMCIYINPIRGVPYTCFQNPNTTTNLKGYVHLKKELFFSSETLKIAEIAIITTHTDSFIKNWKSAEQSNGITGGGSNGPLNAIDYSFNTCIYTDQTDVSNQGIRGWWRADLIKAYKVLGFEILDYRTNDQEFRGNYKLYVDITGFTKNNLCAFDNQTLASTPHFVPCENPSYGRYITVEREPTSLYRQDKLSFCNIELIVIATETVFTYPENNFYTLETPTTTRQPIFSIVVTIGPTVPTIPTIPTVPTLSTVPTFSTVTTRRTTSGTIPAWLLTELSKTTSPTEGIDFPFNNERNLSGGTSNGFLSYAKYIIGAVAGYLFVCFTIFFICLFKNRKKWLAKKTVGNPRNALQTEGNTRQMNVYERANNAYMGVE